MEPAPVEEPAPTPEAVAPEAHREEGVTPATLAELAQDDETATTEEGEELPSVDIDEEGLVDETPELAPTHEFIPKAEDFGEASREEALTEAAAPAAAEQLSRAEVEELARETIEKIAWEVVPKLAETILREEIDKLVKEKLSS